MILFYKFDISAKLSYGPKMHINYLISL